MTGSDDRTPPGENAGSRGRRRALVGKADPTPVTEAMITPRTTPQDPEEATDPTPVTEAMITPRTTPPDPEEVAVSQIRFCYSCGIRNKSGGSYCLACGISFRRPTEPTRSAYTGSGTIAQERTGDSAVAGVVESPPERWDEGQDPNQAAPSVPIAQRRLRLLLIMILVITILVLAVNMLTNRDVEQTEPSTITTVAARDSGLQGVLGRYFGDGR